jgi:predicted Co/Zn/Cd cation transporter (cation efflux family)
VRNNIIQRDGSSVAMQTIISANILVFVLIAFISIVIGVNPKKWFIWLLGLYGFLSGSLVGFLRDDSSLDLQLGAIFAFAVMSSSAMIYVQRQRFSKDTANSWLARYGEEKHYFFLTRIIKKFLNK